MNERKKDMIEIKIREMRDKKRISLRTLSRKTKISIGALNNYENNKTSPTLDNIEEIAKALNCKITDLFESEYK
ncbi:MAG: helix-turn-helix domain-containing protein [Clostridia bacterium]|jgi:transcriptional regulator with XRE-family HTH domain